jgi:two-component system, chemotaxis family, protein-glutamate methylesterase/glutaminase
VSRPRVRVLVVDDSAFARKVVRQVLEGNDAVEVVGTARDGLDALEKIAALRPDVVTVDLVMPQLDGLGLLAALPAENPPRVVVVSSASGDSDLVVAAMQAGAVTAVHKPTALATDRLYDISHDLVTAVLRAAEAAPPPAPAVAPRPIAVVGGPTVQRRLVVFGASTGGPNAVTRVLTALPASFPVPIALVVHMPVGYTEAFARRLDEQCALEVVEARDQLALVPGRVVIGRAGLHLVVRASSAALTARLDALPLDRPHRPSVDVLFASAARAVGADALGVVFTGMGDDGLAGARAITGAGGAVITQSASSCVVYGMPRCVVEAGLSVESADIEGIPEAIVRHLTR